MSQSSFLLHLSIDRRRVVDIDDVWYLEGARGDTLVRLRGRRRLRDARRLGALADLLVPRGLLRIHHDYLVNPAHVLEVRRREGTRGWELKLAPPVNAVLPIARDREGEFFAHFGE